MRRRFASGHLTISPLAVQAGVYEEVPQVFNLLVEHASHGEWTSKLELSTPEGVSVVLPVVKSGWNITLEYRPLPPWLQFSDDDGDTVTQVVSKVIWAAESPGVPGNEYLDRFAFQVTFGCNFSDTTTNTRWQHQYAVWFPRTQYLSEFGSSSPISTEKWTGVVSGAEKWEDGVPHPCPHMIVAFWSKCTSGLLWFGSKSDSPNTLMMDILQLQQQDLGRY